MGSRVTPSIAILEFERDLLRGRTPILDKVKEVPYFRLDRQELKRKALELLKFQKKVQELGY